MSSSMPQSLRQSLRQVRDIFVTSDVFQLPMGPYVSSHKVRFSKKSREIVLAAAKQGAVVLNYAAPYIKNDREIVLAAVLQKTQTTHFGETSS